MSVLRTNRATAGLVGAAVLVAGGFAIVEVRAEAHAAAEAEQRAAQQDLHREVFALRSDLAAPAHVAERAAAGLLVTVAETVTGSGRDTEAVRANLDDLISDLQAAADQLDEAATQPLPDRPQAVPVQASDAIFGRLEGIEMQAAEVAATIREAADGADTFASAAHQLTSAATTYAASTDELPDSDDPDVLATAWRAERERLDVYLEAVEVAAETPGLEGLAETHRELIDTLRTLAGDAVSDLEAGDVDAYNDRLDAVLGDDEAASLSEDLVAATEAALGAATLEQLQQARTVTLELLIDLEDLRRVTGPSAG